MAVTSPKKERRVTVKVPPHYLPPPTFAVVQIPRAVWSAAYWDLDWAHLAALAEVGQNGLSLSTKQPTVPHAPAGTVWMRRGPSGQSLLYHQNWRD